MNKYSIKILAPLLTFAFTVFITNNYAQDVWNCSGSAYDFNGKVVNSIANQNNRYDDVVSNDSPIDYHYNARYSYPHMDGSYRDFKGYIHFGRRFDNSDNFTSGISSYQGTSTGPGPNGGYPGSPRGTYQTNYLNNSIYPNSYYMPVYSR